MIRAKFIGERHDLESSPVKRVAKQAQRPVVGGARSCVAGCTAVRLGV